MVRKLTKEESKFYRKYHIPGCGNLTSVKVNALFIRKGNTYEHEAAKFRVCWNLLKEGKTFLTEAARSKKCGDKSEKVVDVVDLTGETEIEVVHRNESHADVKAYRCEGVVPVIVDSFICAGCGLRYPVKNKLGVCDFCK